MVEFSFNSSTYVTNEQDGEVTLCVQSMDQLEETIILEVIFSSLSANPSDFDNSSLVYEFEAGFVPGNTVCRTVGIIMDGIVEDSESFSAILMANPEMSFVRITQDRAEIIINDSPGDRKLVFTILCIWTVN